MARTKKSKRDTQPAWRPDFRNVERLPDIKVIRTGFLLNIVAVTVVALLGAYLGFDFVLARSIGTEIDSLEEQIAAKERANRNWQMLNGAFNRESVQFKELEGFLGPWIHADELLVEIAERLPQEAVLSTCVYEGFVESKGVRGSNKTPYLRLTLDGTLAPGEVRDPFEAISQFQEDIESFARIGEQLRIMELRAFDRDDELGLFTFSLVIELQKS